MAPIKVGILGFGMSATVFHLPFVLALPELFQLVSIYERSATPEKSAARDAFPSANVVNTLDGVLSDPDVELVFVTTINDTHFEFAKKAIEAGKHVVVEKPLTPTAAEAWELAKLAKEKNVVLAVYQNRRWDSDFLTVKSLLDKGAFGDLTEFESHFDRYKNVPATTKLWKEKALPGSGAAFDLGSHLLDQILSTFGKPTAVTAVIRNARNFGNADVDDSFIIHLHYPATEEEGRKLPMVATARGTFLSLLTPQNRFIIKGTKGAFVKNGLDVQEDQLKAAASSAVAQADFGKEPESLAGTLYTADGAETIPTATGHYLSWFENVAEAIQSKDRSKLIVTPEQAALTIEIIEAAYKSSKLGQTLQL